MNIASQSTVSREIGGKHDTAILSARFLKAFAALSAIGSITTLLFGALLMSAWIALGGFIAGLITAAVLLGLSSIVELLMEISDNTAH